MAKSIDTFSAENFWQTRPILRYSIRRSNTSMTGHLLWKEQKIHANNPLIFGWTGFKHASVALTVLVVRCNSHAHQIRGSLLIWVQHKDYAEHFKKFDNMYWIALNDANYKVASFKRSYNGNQRRFVWATGLEAQSFTVLNISNVTNPTQKLLQI
jgi:hypothetical protein